MDEIKNGASQTLDFQQHMSSLTNDTVAVYIGVYGNQVSYGFVFDKKYLCKLGPFLLEINVNSNVN